METYDRVNQFLGNRILEIGCGGGQLAQEICSKIKVERYVGFEVNSRLTRDMIDNPPDNFEFVKTNAHDVRYNPRGMFVVVPEGEFNTVIGKSWMTHVTMNVLSTYTAWFAKRLCSGGHMIQTCFIDEELAGSFDAGCLHTYYSRESLENLSEHFELISVDMGGWVGGIHFAPHDIAVWRRL